MLTLFLIWIGKVILFISRTFNFGAGGTWPGEIVLKFDPNILAKIAPKKIILVAGTNGKTTTVKIIRKILGDVGGLRVITNESGANLLNGIVSSLISVSDWKGEIKTDWAILETDEATLPQIIEILNQVQDDDKSFKLIIILLNLFRDQLDRYGEVDTIAKKWQEALKNFSGTLILNADDPQIANLGKGKSIYFGLNDQKFFQKTPEHAMDSQFCPNCGQRLNYAGTFYSHLGIWECKNCGLKRPKLDLSNWSDWANLKGVYNRYNVLAAVLACKETGMVKEEIEKRLVNFKPAFGRQEKIGDAKIFLAKNPAGFNESLRTVIELGAKNILFSLNDRIPDGRDVSWIWDVDFEMISQIGEISQIGVSGDRAYDLGLRLKYAEIRDFRVFGEIGEAIKTELEKIQKGKILYILATYSAMLEIRKKLTGRKIL